MNILYQESQRYEPERRNDPDLCQCRLHHRTTAGTRSATSPVRRAQLADLARITTATMC